MIFIIKKETKIFLFFSALFFDSYRTLRAVPLTELRYAISQFNFLFSVHRSLVAAAITQMCRFLTQRNRIEHDNKMWKNIFSF